MINCNDGSHIYEDLGASFVRNPKGQQTVYRRSGDVVYGSNGSRTYRSGQNLYIHQSKGTRSVKVYKNGDRYYTDTGKSYTMCGSILYSSTGKHWFDIKSDEDAETVIILDND